MEESNEKQLESQKAKVARLPVKDELVELFGLVYQVKYVDNKHGELWLRFVRQGE